MKKSILIIIFIISFYNLIAEPANELVVELTRRYGKDIFELNGIPYTQPLVEAINATSNSRFFSGSFVPKKVDKPYFKLGFHSMLGFVRDDKKTFKPQLPSDTFDLNTFSKYAEYDIMKNQIKIKDTIGLIHYTFKIMAHNGLQQGSLKTPESTATVLGKGKSVFILPNDTLLMLMHTLTIPGTDIIIYNMLSPEMQKQIDSTMKQFPEHYSLPEGGDMNTLFTFIPQFEIGSLWGTELLIRFIPPVYMGENIGDFAFWGIGLKHSISQYFFDEYDENDFNLAVQGVYQGTSLKNTIGVTGAKLRSFANIWNFNIQASKRIYDLIDIYSGFSFEWIHILSDYTYTLPVETQWKLGLLQGVEDPTAPNGYRILPPNPPEYPGDTKPQNSSLALKDFNFKWVIGFNLNIDPVSICIDFNLSKFNLFTAGIFYKF